MGVSPAKGHKVVLNRDNTPLADVTVELGRDARPAGRRHGLRPRHLHDHLRP
ncbi:hypothetical protein [Streptomyces sp. NPDC056701]|uniref:hypothetical protein n=1 Tax=Streptomyces sp. NPDC056701 TaxID=3345916 RepID=UPI0036C5D04A